MVFAYEEKNNHPLRENNDGSTFNRAIMCPQSTLDVFYFPVGRTHDRQDRFGLSRPH